ncbi:SurA N-terminal domain-containing protein [Paenibacillus sp. FSL R5-0407]|uniref:SurA N-terminal domain-containing protein n=1 Tax=Paenibacillus sp. FSL R5-0407 TaxID=2975320 RepID=UPI0030FBAE2B
MNKPRFLIISFIVLLVAVSSSLYAFGELKDQNSSMDKSNYIISEGDIVISKPEFDFYKVNIKLMNQLNATLDNSSDKIASLPRDQELIDEMLKKRISVQHAKEIGITVTEGEVKEVINREKNMLNSEEVDAQNQAIIREIMDQRIKLTGLSEEEFWDSDLVFKEYEKTLYIDKLYNKLIGEKVINDIQGFEEFQINLLKEYKNSHSINLE